MIQGHIINHAEFDITFADEQEVQQQHPLLAEFIKDELLVVVNEVFDEVSGSGEVLRIDSLAIDLGNFPTLTYREEMRKTLKQQLRETLQVQRSAAAIMPVKGTELLAPAYSDIEVLEFFLLRGYFPWHLRGQQQQDFMDELEVLVEQHGDAIVEFLRQHHSRFEVLDRLVKQLSPSLLIRLIQHCMKVGKRSGRVHLLLNAMIKKVAASATSTNSQQSAWLALFRCLFNQQAMLQQHRDELFFSLAGQFGVSEENIALSTTPEAIALNQQSEQKKQRELANSLRKRVALFSDGIIRGKSDALRTEWKATLLEHAPVIEMILRQYGLDGDVRRRIAYGFDEQMLQDIAELLEPNESDFIIGLMSCPALFYSPQQPPPQGESKLKCQLWSYTLGYLLVERGSEFNKRSYMSSVLMQLAAHENVSVFGLLDSMQALLDQVPISSQLRHEMLSLMVALREQWAEPLVSNFHAIAEDDGSLDASVQASPSPLQRWLMALLQKEQPKVTLADNLMSAALSEKTIALLSSCLRDDDISADILAALNDKQRIALVHQLNPQASESIRLLVEHMQVLHSALLQRFTYQRMHTDVWQFSMTYLVTSSTSNFNQQDYFRTLFKYLAKHYQVSLKQWSADLLDQPQAATLPTLIANEIKHVLHEERRGGTKSEPTVSIDVQLLGLLEGGVHLALDRLWLRWREQDADELRGALLRVGREARVRHAIVRQASEQTLLDLVELLEPAHTVFVGEVVTQLSLYQPDEAIAQPVLRNTLWEFTLAYLLVDRGSQFNRKSYLASLIKRLAAHHNQTELSLLQGLLRLVQRLVPKNSESVELIDLMQQLAEQQQVDGEPSQNDELDESWRVVFDYQQLREWLAIGAVDRAEPIVQYFKMLQQQAPWLLMALFRELRSETVIRQTLLKLPEQALVEVLEIWFEITQHSNGGAAQSELLRAIRLYADRTEQRHHYYQLILCSLLEQQLIDFEFIMKQLNKINSREAEIPLSQANRATVKPDEQIECSSRGTVDKNSTTGEARYASQLQRFIQQPQLAWQAAELQDALEWLLQQDALRFPAQFALGLQNSVVIERLIGLVPESMLLRLLHHIHPSIAHDMWRLFSVMNSAVSQLEQPLSPSLAWRYLFHYLFVEGQLFDESRFILGYVTYSVGELDASQRELWRSQFCLQLVKDSLPSTQVLVQSIIHQLEEAPSAEDSPTMAPDSSPEAMTTSPQEVLEDEPDEEIYIENAGLVLLSPYIPRLFEMLGLLTEGRFNDRNAAERAVHLLQYLVAQCCNAGEYQLVLNKLLCGVRTGQPILREIEISEQEDQALNGLLQGIIQNWSALGNTSAEGLRESFLMRDGCLQRKDDVWHLVVEKRAYDVLLDQLPWSYSPVKHAWMERVIYVEWR